ncbi:MAG TPA: archaeal heat shock protein Hsp20 [Candidatus Dormibacteraeota bacterium]|nr:archaeal heat shock protein Hsp20 [Candidatus Dormibacteraeota bacterium]
MSSDDFLPDWFRPRRGRRTPFGWMDRWFSDVDEMFENMFQDMLKGMPKDMMSERKLPDGSTVRQFGPFVYGYSMTMGPDGKPVIQEFGNVKPSRRPGAFGMEQPALEPKNTREPLVDVINEPAQVRVVAELPGVEKSAIKTSISDDMLTISVDSATQKYYKEVHLPTGVDSESSKATYNNGVLEITLRKTQPKLKGREIHID